MQMDLCYAGKQKRNCYIVGREPGSVCGWEKSAGRCALPLLWGLDLDDLLWELNDSGYYMLEYANDQGSVSVIGARGNMWICCHRNADVRN
jgi:hypothetical protein